MKKLFTHKQQISGRVKNPVAFLLLVFVSLTNKELRNIIKLSFIQGVNKYAARYS